MSSELEVIDRAWAMGVSKQSARTAEEVRQAAHYDRIAERYEQHYSDSASQAYRRRFIDEPLTRGLDFHGLRVLDAMCGSGQTVPLLVSKGAKVTGLDISSEVMRSFQEKWPSCEGIVASILDSGIANDSFDCVIAVGGLHHLQPYVDRAMDEIYRILRPNGYLCFVEPVSGSIPDKVRRLWYRVDKMFEKNEQAIDVKKLQAQNRHRYTFLKTHYFGNVAYLLVYNSLIFRVPLWLKRLYAPLLILVEQLLNRLSGRRLACAVVCQWRKSPSVVTTSQFL
jgi:SAM-dependent methyltransferase